MRAPPHSMCAMWSSPATDLREAGHGQERADAEERDDRRDDEALEEERSVAVAKRGHDAPEHTRSIGAHRTDWRGRPAARAALQTAVSP